MNRPAKRQDDRLRRVSTPQRRLYRYAFALASTLSVVLATVFYLIDNETSDRVKLSQVGIGLGSSVLFALIFTALVNREQSQLLRDEVGDVLSSVVQEILADVRATNEAYLPSRNYPGTAGFDVAFNTDITRDLISSSRYVFRGSSAKYVPVRLRNARRAPASVKVLILNPASPASTARRAADRMKNPKYAHLSEIEVRQQLLEELTASIVALFDCRSVCSVEIGYIDTDPSVQRIEIFDDAAYVSLYHTDSSASQAFPQTVRYSRTSIFHEVYSMECTRQFEDASNVVRFTARDDHTKLNEHLKKLGLPTLTSKRAQEIRESNAMFAKQFASHLSNLTV